jgi:hypothetical protein
MKLISLRWAVLVAALSLLAACGGGGGGGGGGSADTTCTPNANLVLQNSTGDPLLNITVTINQGEAAQQVPVYAAYMSPPVAAIVAGYPPGATDPRTVGIDIAIVGSTTANPLQFSLSFNPTGPKGTYDVTWRFVAVDTNVNIVACQDLPVTFTIQ